MNSEPKKKPQSQHSESVSLNEATGMEERQHLPAPLKESHAESPVIVLKPEELNEPATSSLDVQTPKAAISDRPRVHVVSNLLDLVSGRSVSPAERQAAKEQRDLNHIVHQMLIIGLAISTILMLAGLALDFILAHDVPTAVPDFNDVFNRVIALRPSGFLALGLLVLIATPILRVVGSIFVFIYERDWRYAGITCLVLGIVMISLFLGKG